MQCFILAGGFATRLWPLTEKRAKPLLPLVGKPIISHLAEKIPQDIPVTVSTNAAFEEGFDRWIHGWTKRTIRLLVEDSRHDDQKLGALGAVAQWIADASIDDDILLLTGDNYLGFRMEDFLAAYRDGTPLLAAHDIGDKARASSFGTVVVDAKHKTKVMAFEEKPKDPKTSLVSTGCSVLPRSVLPIIKEFAKVQPENVGGIFEEFLRRGVAVDCFTFTEPWLDIGSFRAYLDAHRLLLEGTTMTHPQCDVSDMTSEGNVCIAEGCTIKNSVLKDTVIFGNCQINNCTITECVIDEGCRLEGVDLKGKMVRANTVLEIAS